MILNFKGPGFTAKSGTSLCDTCNHCHKLEGARLGDTRTLCGYSRDFFVTFPVLNCTQYEERGRMSLHKMYQEAWTLAQDKSGKIGFYSRDEFKKREDRLKPLGKDFDPYDE